jgi:hypothetical protein
VPIAVWLNLRHGSECLKNLVGAPGLEPGTSALGTVIGWITIGATDAMPRHSKEPLPQTCQRQIFLDLPVHTPPSNHLKDFNSRSNPSWVRAKNFPA